MTIALKKKLTKKTVDSIAPADKDVIVLDRDITGYGLRVKPSGVKSYFIRYRNTHGESRWYTLGQHGPLTPDRAREKAMVELGRVADGYDPSEERKLKFKEMTISELCDLYIKEGCKTKKESTFITYKSLIKHHIRPLLGRKKITAVRRSDVEKMKHDIVEGKTAADEKTKKHGRAIVRGGKGAASRVVSLLSAIFSFALTYELVKDNPCRDIKKFPGKNCDRFLSAKEFKDLGDALNEAEKAGESLSAINMIRMLILTGCRRGEIQTLKWEYIDWDNSCLKLPDSKTGEKVVHLATPAIAVLKKQKRDEDNPYVFYGTKANRYFVGLTKVWISIQKRKACLGDVRIHDLRHSFASVGVNSGHSLMFIGALLGHSSPGTTARYAHLSDDPVLTTLDDIVSQIDGFMTEKKEKG